jgi:hypothetical protein
MPTIPYDDKEIRDKLKLSFANLKKGGTGDDDKNKKDDNPNHRRTMSDVAKYRDKVKELTAQIQNKDATLEEKNKAVADLQKLNEEQATALSEAQKKIADLEPVAEAARKDEHRRRSILLDKIPKEERKEWQDAPIALLEKYVGKAPGSGGENPGKGGKPDFKKLINESGTDEGMKALNTAIESNTAEFEEYNKQGVQ